MSQRSDANDENLSEAVFSGVTPLNSSLGLFAHLPAYQFDFDYRGDSIRHATLSPQLSAITQPHLDSQPYTTSALVDDFDSYMFPDIEELERPRIFSHDYPQHSSSSDLSQRRTDSQPPSPAKGTPPPPPEIDWRAVDAAQLFLPNGAQLDPDKLYTGYTKNVVLVFVRRQAVELAGLVYGKVAHLLQQAGARLVFVTAWEPSQAAIFLSRFERVSPFPGAIVCDPHASLFAAFGFTRSPFRALFSGPKVSAPMRQGVRNAFSTVSYRAQNRDIASTSVSSKRLKCGAVVLPSLRGYAKRPVLRYHGEEAPSTGVGCYLDVLDSCGVNEAFVPDIDVAQVYSRFNSMRVTSIKARTADEKEAKVKAQKQSRSSRKNEKRNALKVP